MANEGRLRIQASVDNGNLDADFDEQYRYNQTTAVVEEGDQIVGTVHEAIRLGDVTAPQDMVLFNRDATNYVEIGIDQAAVFVPVVKILPGRMAVVPPSAGVTLYGRANTAAVKVQRFIPET